MKYIALFIAIQLASLGLTIIGVPVCFALAYLECSKPSGGMWHWPKWAWIFDNKEDGVWPGWYANTHLDWSAARLEFHWTALRNPCNNLRYVRGISKVGRPLWRKTWTMRGKPYYAQAGWNASGFPVLSAGFDIHA